MLCYVVLHSTTNLVFGFGTGNKQKPFLNSTQSSTGNDSWKER